MVIQSLDAQTKQKIKESKINKEKQIGWLYLELPTMYVIKLNIS